MKPAVDTVLQLQEKIVQENVQHSAAWEKSHDMLIVLPFTACEK
jgi:hypothetical protein